MAMYRCDLRDDRRSLLKETREIEDVEDGDELERVARSMAQALPGGRRREGLRGLRLRVHKLDRSGGTGRRVTEVAL